MTRFNATVMSWLTVLSVLLACSAANGIIVCHPPLCPDPDVVDCGNEPQSKVCEECCTQSSCPCGNACLICCPDPNNCIVTPPPKPSGLSLGFKVLLGGVAVAFERKLGSDNPPAVKIKLRETFKSATGHRTVSLQTTLTGADAAVGSLLYPVAFVGLGANALDALRAQGYDVSDSGKSPAATCQGAMLRPEGCTDLANQLARTLDATLATGDSVERGAFLAGVQALGFQSCQGPTSTTSTTLCGTGTSDCGGVCVDLTSDPNNCGTCGNGCTRTTPSCVLGTCTSP